VRLALLLVLPTSDASITAGVTIPLLCGVFMVGPDAQWENKCMSLFVLSVAQVQISTMTSSSGDFSWLSICASLYTIQGGRANGCPLRKMPSVS